MKRHGPDPHSGALVASGFAMAIDAITAEIDPKLRLAVLIMLARKEWP
jgi:hypothetical protein